MKPIKAWAQGRYHGVDLDFFGDLFSNSSKFDERRLREGSFFASQRSVLDIHRLQLSDQLQSFGLCSLQPTMWDLFLRSLE